MADLKYYAMEADRYGSMGDMTKAQMHAALEKAYAKFGMPRIDLKFARTPRKASWARVGLGMVGLGGHIAEPLSLPTIKMAPNHMYWQLFCHELAHHLHYTRLNADLTEKATRAGAMGTPEEYRVWLGKNFKKQRAHGHEHRKLMQEVVDFFREIGMITVLPTYAQRALDLVKAINRPTNPEVVAMAAEA
jgi:hypothetical protein